LGGTGNRNLPVNRVHASVAHHASVRRPTITANSLLRDAAVFVDRLDAEATVNDQLVTLLPGESFTFAIESARELTLEALTHPPAFQCANRFGRK